MSILDLLRRTRPVHYPGECDHCGIDELPPSSCPTLKLIAEVDAALHLPEQEREIAERLLVSIGGESAIECSCNPHLIDAETDRPLICGSCRAIGLIVAALQSRPTPRESETSWQAMTTAPKDGSRSVEAIDYDELDPGIRDTVRLLRGLGFDTTDSGDGVTKLLAGWSPSEALDTPHVFSAVALGDVWSEADRMALALGEEWTVEASYSARDKSAVLLAFKSAPARPSPEATHGE